jgi:flagellar basal-body rod protein FlgC
MGDMIVAQRAYQANANVVDRAKATYEAAINIGKGV